jgi:hypothetical protein
MGFKKHYPFEVSFTISYKVKVAGNSRDIFSDAEYMAKRMLLDEYGLDFDQHRLDIKVMVEDDLDEVSNEE